MGEISFPRERRLEKTQTKKKGNYLLSSLYDVKRSILAKENLSHREKG